MLDNEDSTRDVITNKSSGFIARRESLLDNGNEVDDDREALIPRTVQDNNRGSTDIEGRRLSRDELNEVGELSGCRTGALIESHVGTRVLSCPVN